MLHKALLSSPKEFRVSIGTQTYCAASVNKSSAMPASPTPRTTPPPKLSSCRPSRNKTFPEIIPLTSLSVQATLCMNKRMRCA